MPPRDRPPPWLTSQRPLRALARQLAEGRVVPFVGAGTSIGLGMPSWPKLVEILRELVGAATGQRASTDPLLAAAEAKAALGASYGGRLAGAFALDAPRKAAIAKSPVFGSLATLPCVYYVTTNYDLALEHAIARHRPRSRPDSFSWSDEGAVNRFLQRRHERRSRPAVIHLHGRVDVPEDIVLTEDDYQQRYWWAGTDRVRLATFFATYSALFVGCSLTDEDLKSVLREVRARFRFTGGQHFWLRGVVDEAEWSDAAGRAAHAAFWRTKFGVDVVDYPAPGHDHAALAVALDAVRADATRRARGDDATAAG